MFDDYFQFAPGWASSWAGLPVVWRSVLWRCRAAHHFPVWPVIRLNIARLIVGNGIYAAVALIVFMAVAAII